MRFRSIDPPRQFDVQGFDFVDQMFDCGRIELEPNELVTFLNVSGGEYDVTRKNWGFYATPSINGRLIKNGFRSAIVMNGVGHIFVMLVEQDKQEEFQKYIKKDHQTLLCWLDKPETLERLKKEFLPVEKRSFSNE